MNSPIALYCDHDFGSFAMEHFPNGHNKIESRREISREVYRFICAYVDRFLLALFFFRLAYAVLLSNPPNREKKGKMCVAKLGSLLSQRTGIVFILWLAPSVVMGTSLGLDTEVIGSESYLISGTSDTNLGSIRLKFFSEGSCTALEQFVVTEPSGDQTGILITQMMEEV